MMNQNSIADGVPMNLEQMQAYLQEYHGFLVVLREQGTMVIKCPYCGEMHDHGPQPGHHVADCSEEIRYDGIGITIGERYFVPNYGYTIYEYRKGDKINELVNFDIEVVTSDDDDDDS